MQSKQLDRISNKLTIKPVPVLFAGLLNHHGQLGPAEIQSKRNFTFKHALWLATKKEIDMKLPSHHPFNPLRPLRLAIVKGCSMDCVRIIFDFIWQEGRNIDDDGELDALGFKLGTQDAIFKIQKKDIKEKLHEYTNDAIKEGVFGVPTLIVDGELFWGLDSTDFLKDFLTENKKIKENILNPVDNFRVGKAKRKIQ